MFGSIESLNKCVCFLYYCMGALSPPRWRHLYKEMPGPPVRGRRIRSSHQRNGQKACQRVRGAEEIPTGEAISEETDKMGDAVVEEERCEMKDPLQLDDGHKCVMCEARLASKEELQEHFRLHANSQIDMKGRKAVNAVKPIVKQVIFLTDIEDLVQELFLNRLRW